MSFSDVQKQIERAGISDEEGLLTSRGWPSEKTLVPPIVGIQGDVLRWQDAAPIGQDRLPRRTDPKGMLDAFLRIKSDNDVLRFAKRWGPLRLCRHELPYTHLLNPAHTTMLDPDWSARSRYVCAPRGVEPLAAWHHFVAQAHALVEVAAALQVGRKVPRQAWQQLFAPEDGGKYSAQLEAMLADSTDHRVIGGLWTFYLKPLLDLWLRWGDVHLGCSPTWLHDVSRSPLYLETGTFGLLGIQMMAALAGGNSIAICSACGEAYMPRRKPQRGRQSYCSKPECKGQGHRIRQRAYQARKDQKG